MDIGYVIIPRTLKSWRWYSDEQAMQMLTHLMLSVNFKSKPYKKTVIGRGELLTSYRHLAEVLDKSIDQVRGTLNKMASTHDITRKRVGNGILIKLTSFEETQALASGSKSNKKGEHPRPAPDLNQPLTDDAPITKESNKCNHAIIQECNKSKGSNPVDNLDDGEFKSIGEIFARQMKGVSPTLADIQNYCEARGNRVDAEAFYNYYENRDWLGTDGTRLKNWKQAIHRWEVRQVRQELQKW